MPKVNYGDTGIVLNFPDTMTREQIASAIKANEPAIRSRLPKTIDLNTVMDEDPRGVMALSETVAAPSDKVSSKYTPSISVSASAPYAAIDQFGSLSALRARQAKSERDKAVTAARSTGTPAGVGEVAPRAMISAFPLLGEAAAAAEANDAVSRLNRLKTDTWNEDDIRWLKGAVDDAKRGSTFAADLVSSIGGSVGMAANSALGAALGTLVAPGVGTVAGAIGGMAAPAAPSRIASFQTPELKIEADAQGNPTNRVIIGQPAAELEGEAITKGIGLSVSDALIERAGGPIARGVGRVIAPAASRIAPRLTSLARRASGSNVAERAQRLASIGGPASEFAEEVAQSGVAEYAGDPNADTAKLLDPREREAQVTAATVLLLGGAPLAIGALSRAPETKDTTEDKTPATAPDETVDTAAAEDDIDSLIANVEGRRSAPAAQQPAATPNQNRVPTSAFGSLFPEAKENPAYAPEGAAPDFEQAPLQGIQDSDTARGFERTRAPRIVGMSPISEGSPVYRNAVVSPAYAPEGATPDVGIVPFGTQQDRTVSPIEALGILAGVDMSNPSNHFSDQNMEALQAALSQPQGAGLQPPPVSREMEPVLALYEMVRGSGSIEPLFDEQSIADFADQFEVKSERQQIYEAWKNARESLDAMTPEEQDAWANQLLGVTPSASQEQEAATVYGDVLNQEGAQQGGEALPATQGVQGVAPEPQVAARKPQTRKEVTRNEEGMQARRRKEEVTTPEPVPVAGVEAAQPEAPATAQPKPKREAPQRRGTTSATGWVLAGKGLWRKDIGGRNVKIVRNTDKTFSVLRDDVEVDTGYKTSKEAQAYADGELTQDIMDEAEISATETSMTESAQPESKPSKKGKKQGPSPADTGLIRDIEQAASDGRAFVDGLYAKVKPYLSRIAEAAKTASDYIASAVREFGNAIRPYAVRFAKELRRAVSEERGAAINPFGEFGKDKKERDRINRALGAEYKQGEKDAARDVAVEKKLSSAEATAEERERGRAREEKASQTGFDEGNRYGRKMGQLYEKMTNNELSQLIGNTLDPSDKAPLLAAMKRLVKDSTITKEARDRRMRKYLVGMMKKVERKRAIDSAKDAISKVRSERARLHPDVQAAFDAIMDSFSVSKPTSKSVANAQTVVDNLTNDIVGASVSASQQRAAIDTLRRDGLKPLKDMTRDEALAIRDSMEALLDAQKAIESGLKESLNEKKKRNRTEAVADIAQKAKLVKRKDWISGIKQAMREIVKSHSNTAREVAKKGSYLHDTLVEDLDEADSNYDNRMIEMLDTFQKRLADAGISEKDILEMSYVVTGEAQRGISAIDYQIGAAVKRAVNAEEKAKIRSIDIGGGQTIELTGAEIITIINQLRTPDTRYNLANAGYQSSLRMKNKRFKVTPEVASAIVEAATKKEVAVADIMFDMVNGELQQMADDTMTRLFARRLSNGDTYYPRRRATSDQEPAISLYGTEGSMNTQAETFSILKPKIDAQHPIELDDAFQAFASHINKVVSLSTKLEASMNARRLLDTSEVKDAIKQEFTAGENLLNKLREGAREWGSSGGGVDGMLSFVRYLQRKYAVSKLALNVPVIASQPYSVMSAGKVIPQDFLFQSFVSGGNLKDAIAEADKHSGTLRNIIRGTGHAVLNPGSTSAISARELVGIDQQTIGDKAMKGVQLSNDAAVGLIWKAAKLWGESNGLAGQELIDFTAKQARKAWVQTQPSTSKVYSARSRVHSATSAAYTALTMFQSQTSIQFNDALDSIHDYIDSSDKKSAKQIKKVVLNSLRPLFVQAALFASTKYAYDEFIGWLTGERDEPPKGELSKEREAIWNVLVDSTVGQMPAIGPFLRALATAIQKGARGQSVSVFDEFDIPLIQVLVDITKGTNASVKAATLNNVTENDRKNITRMLDIVLGIPVSQATNVISKFAS